jgi:hypothetical protein
VPAIDHDGFKLSETYVYATNIQCEIKLQHGNCAIFVNTIRNCGQFLAERRKAEGKSG